MREILGWVVSGLVDGYSVQLERQRGDADSGVDCVGAAEPHHEETVAAMHGGECYGVDAGSKQ